MSENKVNDPMLDMYIFETLQLINQLEEIILTCEEENNFINGINEIFRIMHTIKGNSAMMVFNNIAELAHQVEDLFDFFRKSIPENLDCSKVVDIVLESIDFIKNQIEKIKEGNQSDGSAEELIKNIKTYLKALKSDEEHYRAVIYFEEDCGMENVRAFTIINRLQDEVKELNYEPSDIIENNNSSEVIKNQGFKIELKSSLSLEELDKILNESAFLKDVKLEVFNNKNFKNNKINQLEDKIDAVDEKEVQIQIDDKSSIVEQNKKLSKENNSDEANQISKSENKHLNDNKKSISKQSVLSVNVEKLDILMDLVGEVVIAEAMVTRNPELKQYYLDNFYKSARQLRKIINNIQDVVMSIRMVPLSSTFRKMNRIVRDMSKKLDKDVRLEIIGEETEVDKNIIENIGDPLMHIIRNAVDHGIESREERKVKGKSEQGVMTLEAKNEGGDVWIIVKDDGKGLDREKILKKAREHGLTNKSDSKLTDREINSFILLPGFSTNENITEFSGRGVGMDVVMKNIEKVRGTVIVDSEKNKGTIISIKIPLTLAIIDGMTIRVGKSRYTIPITAIKQSFKVKNEEVIIDPDGNEMILVRGECYRVIRLHEIFSVNTDIKEIEDGIIIMLENESKSICIFADELIVEQQVVVKALPKYIKKVKGIAGCTQLGDGGISLIMDIASLIE